MQNDSNSPKPDEQSSPNSLANNRGQAFHNNPDETEVLKTPVAGSRIIQPITKNLIIDPVSTPAILGERESTMELSTDLPFDPITHNAPYTFNPVTTAGFVSGDAALAVNQMTQRNKTSKKIIIAVRIFGSFITLVAIIDFVFNFQSFLSPGIFSAILLITSLAEVLLGVGIILRKELARAIFVILSFISIIFTAYSTFAFLGSAAHPTAFSILSLLLDWAILLTPLIFLTRSRVKEIFS